MDEQETDDTATVPVVSTLTSSPLRNRLRVELGAPVSEVWALIGNLTRYPEYSFGLERVDANVDSRGMCTEYLCRFRPREEGGVSILHREVMRWYEPNRGYASSAEEDTAFGLVNSVTLVTLEPSREGTSMTWAQYYDAHDLDMIKAEFHEALAGIGDNLVRRFGGSVVERYVEEPAASDESVSRWI